MVNSQGGLCKVPSLFSQKYTNLLASPNHRRLVACPRQTKRAERTICNSSSSARSPFLLARNSDGKRRPIIPPGLYASPYYIETSKQTKMEDFLACVVFFLSDSEPDRVTIAVTLRDNGSIIDKGVFRKDNIEIPSRTSRRGCLFSGRGVCQDSRT